MLTINMKKSVLITLALLLTAGTAEVAAQGFLKQLGKTAKKEVENRAINELGKLLKKGTETDASQASEGSDSFYAEMEKRASVGTIATMVEYGPVSGVVNGHEWVDLGLPSGTRWATCNVDAASPEQPGKHYSWNETSAQKWGEGWRVPTEEEMRELLKYCGDKYVQKGGRWGREFTSFINGASIFLPTTGSKEGSRVEEADGCGLYWSSTAHGDDAAHMYTFGAASGEMSIAESAVGLAIRLVTDYDVDTEIPYDGETNGHRWVDLGLPSGLKWATCNLGADAVDQDGGYYKWGGITEYYSGGTYAKSDVQNNISGDAAYDAAAAQWGGTWCMPSAMDFVELMENCTWEWTTIGRRKGLKVTSRHNGKYIFLPASGQCNYNTDSSRLPEDINKNLAYWTSTPMPGWQNVDNAYCFTTLKDEVILRTSIRQRQGWCIRPVTK